MIRNTLEHRVQIVDHHCEQSEAIQKHRRLNCFALLAMTSDSDIWRNALIAGFALLAACGPVPKPAPIAVAPPPTPIRITGLERVIGQDARALVSLFGRADQDVWEASARKLQFGSAICIMDAYLYPPAKGKEPLVTYVDARQPDGKPIDRASCVAALTRRAEAR